MGKADKKQIIVSVTNDLVTDHRVQKVCTSLSRAGYIVLLVGRKLPGSPEFGSHIYTSHRMSLLFKRGPLFYACFNIRLFLFLMFRRCDILLSNDLDTLPANFLVSRLRKKKLVFDSHEYFTEVPELVTRPHIRKIWKGIERFILPHIKVGYTVSKSIADLYKAEYGIPFRVIRNIPAKNKPLKIPSDKIIQTDRKIIIYQGAVNLGRGLPELVRAMQYTNNVLLLIVGTGDIMDEVKNLIHELKLSHCIMMTGRKTPEEVIFYTVQAHLGLSVEQDMGLNYRFALPNKLFDYIAAEIPVMVSNLPEMAELVNHYQIGTVTDSHDPRYLAHQMMEALQNEKKRMIWKDNLRKASLELTWEKEEKILLEIFDGCVGESKLVNHKEH